MIQVDMTTPTPPIWHEDELILPTKKKKPAVPKSEAGREEISRPPTTILGTPSWTEFDFPKKKKKKRPVGRERLCALLCVNNL